MLTSVRLTAVILLLGVVAACPSGAAQPAAPPPGFVRVSPGSFAMGSPQDEPGRFTNETQHQIVLTRAFYIAKHKVTEALWEAVTGEGPAASQLPTNYVSWDAAVRFCNALSSREGLRPAYTIHGPHGDVTWDRDADGYRLPTEAEWEYACRAGSQTAFANGPITYIFCTPLDPHLDQIGWYCGNARLIRRSVGQKQANAWGLHDMHGNVPEWVWDAYRDDYENLSRKDPAHEAGPGAYRVLRGGDWPFHARNCRAAARYFGDPGRGGYPDGGGFRLVRTVF